VGGQRKPELCRHVHKIRQRTRAHLAHGLSAMRLHRNLADAEIARDLLVELSHNDQGHDVRLSAAERAVAPTQLPHFSQALEHRAAAVEGKRDGVEQWRYTDQATISGEPMYLLLNLAVGGDWPGPPDDSTSFPAAMLVDYVRVWTRGTQ